MTLCATKLGAALSGTFTVNPRYRPAGLRAAWTLVAVVIILGVYVLLWLWQVKDLGVTINWTGELLSVQSGTAAAKAGLRPGDYVSFEDFQRLKKISAEAQVGQLVEVIVFRGGAPRTVFLQALPGPIPRALSHGVEALAGILFAILGIAPLVARRRSLSLWIFFAATQLTALFLITDVPSAFHVRWAEIVTYITLPFFPAAVFHFHTLFPQPRLGRWRNQVVLFVYVLAAILLPLDLISFWDYSFYMSDGWQWIVSSYQVLVLLACVGMLARTFITTKDRKVRAQLEVITACSGIGLLIPALLMVPMIMFNLDINDMLKSVAVLSALAVPGGYAYSMLRYNLLIGEVLWRPSLVRVVYTSVFSIGLVALIVFAWPGNRGLTASDALAAWSSIVLIVVVMAGVQEWFSRWAELHLFKGDSYINLLASATDELARFHDLTEYVGFFTERFPVRLKSIGSLVFLAEGQEGYLTLQGCSPSLRSLLVSLPQDWVPALPSESDLRAKLQEVNGPISFSMLLMPDSLPLSTSDTHFLEILRRAKVEWLLPLVSSQRPQLIGLVALGVKETDEPYSAQEITALAALARTASISAENVLMFEALQRRVAELDHERAFSAALARDVSAAQDRERTRISAEIHDTVLQELGVALRLLTRLRDRLQQVLGGLEDSENVLEKLGDPSYMRGLSPVAMSARQEMQIMLDECQTILGTLLGETVGGAQGSGMSVESGQTPGVPLLPMLPSVMPLDEVGGRYLVEDILCLVRSTNERLREICTDLHPAYLDVPLVKTLSRGVERFGQLYPDVHIEIEVHNLEPPNLSDIVKEVCKKIMDQAIHNALNHAKPSTIRVKLAFTTSSGNHSSDAADRALVLSVLDDGIGFEPQPPRYWRSTRRHGLANMYESAALIGGRLHVVSAPGSGTLVDVYIPLNPVSSPDSTEEKRSQIDPTDTTTKPGDTDISSEFGMSPVSV